MGDGKVFRDASQKYEKTVRYESRYVVVFDKYFARMTPRRTDDNVLWVRSMGAFDGMCACNVSMGRWQEAHSASLSLLSLSLQVHT